MSDTVIRVENLGKKYIIGHQPQGRSRYTALRDVLADAAKSVGRRILNPFSQQLPSPAREEFWALKDVSFEIKQGDRVGIIGRNGAGKSTLLKLLSRITEPTTGRISVKGRVASLLEVGTGFHPELTGRENIYLNGAILGMNKAEIHRKFDEIVNFAEVEKFLDTPVKYYSSGMYVRLAFAVAAHLDTEILIVDEVLAVGDAKFQKKCLSKIGEVTQEGKTVLFVSHQMSAIENLCSQAFVLNSGGIVFSGNTKSAVAYYLKDLEEYTQEIKITSIKRSGTGELRITGFSLENTYGERLLAAASGNDLVLAFHYELIDEKPLRDVSFGFSIHSSFGETITILYSDYIGTTFSVLPLKGKIKCVIQDFPFSAGRYLVGARVVANNIELDWPQDYIGYIDVESGDFYKTGSFGHSGTGPVLIRGNWLVESTREVVHQ
ncbi:ABC transporter ATP-binding protein [Trichocoleus desertorum AS-A10]|uniref:ABC transporter ATP-binding protein n=1 Tax=Trichocoleus desertorum TaxID=1481672 RepID=UPI00329A5D90